MDLEPKPPAFHEIADPGQRLAAFFKWSADYCAAQEAANPQPDPTPKPWVDKPGTLIAAEQDVFRGEMLEKLQRVLCSDITRCEHHYCRRRRRCTRLEEIASSMAVSRANLAAEQAKWQPPPAPVELPRRRAARKRAGAGAGASGPHILAR
jgi:hypothetical protein